MRGCNQLRILRNIRNRSGQNGVLIFAGQQVQRETSYPGTSRWISSRIAMGSNGDIFNSSPWASSQTLCRSASPDCAPRDCPMSARVPLPKGNQLANLSAHGIGDAHDHFEIRFRAGHFAGFFSQSANRRSVGERSGLFVSIGRRQHDIGDGRGLGQEMSCTTTKLCEKANGSMPNRAPGWSLRCTAP